MAILGLVLKKVAKYFFLCCSTGPFGCARGVRALVWEWASARACAWAWGGREREWREARSEAARNLARGGRESKVKHGAALVFCVRKGRLVARSRPQGASGFERSR